MHRFAHSIRRILCFIDDETSYAEASGLNLFRRYTLHTGNVFTSEELLWQLENFTVERGLFFNQRRPFDHTDEWLFETQLPSLVTPAYHPAK